MPCNRERYHRSLFSFLSRYSYGAFLIHHVLVMRFIASCKEYLSSPGVILLFFVLAVAVIFGASYI